MAKKVSEFYRQGNDWYISARLPTDISLVVDGVNFHLHKFPLTSKCSKIAKIVEGTQASKDGTLATTLEEFPGGADAFLLVAKYCYSGRVEFSARNVVTIYCSADYLEMTEECGEGNLLSLAKGFLHKTVLRNWKDCILALQTSEPIIPIADKLHIITKCLDALSVMVCTDPSLFGWPMLMYGSLQSPGGSILWNGINTGAKIESIESDWWFEDVSYLCVPLFERLINTLERKGIRPEIVSGAIMYYSRKHLPGLGRWHVEQTSKTRTVASFSMTTPATVDQKILLESIVKLLPDKKGKSYCRFLLGVLRVALILGVDHTCRETLERRIGSQLDLATLDGLLIPSYSDSDTLYNTDCVEKMIHYFLSPGQNISSISPSSVSQENSPSRPQRKVAKLVDSYIAEVASDVNLKPGKLRSLAQALPDSSRTLHDGLYRAIDIYLKAHPWLSEQEKEHLCSVLDFHKLSIDACAHASQNERLPLRVVLQVLFFEQLQFKNALAGCLNTVVEESAPAAPIRTSNDMPSQTPRRDGWMNVVRNNQALKEDMGRMRERVGELEEEFGKIKEEVKRLSKSNNHLQSPRFMARTLGCNLLPRSSNSRPDIIESSGPSPRPSVERSRSSHHSKHKKNFLLVLS